MTEFGKTPFIDVDQFDKMGYSIVIFPVTSLRLTMKAVEKVKALKVLDSRGDWTVEAIVTLEGNAVGYSSVPTGKSVGSFEVKNLPAETSASFYLITVPRTL